MLQAIAVIVSIGIVVVLLVQQLLLFRLLRTIDQLHRDSSRWRAESWRLGIEVQSLRQRVASSPTTLLPAVPATGPAIKTTRTARSAAVPPIAADTGEQPTIGRARPPRNTRNTPDDDAA